jgi:hypothetical protein
VGIATPGAVRRRPEINILALRRQAWPKLLAVHQVLWNAQQPQQKQPQPQAQQQQEAPTLYLYHPTSKDIKAVRKLVKGTISWNITNGGATATKGSNKC